MSDSCYKSKAFKKMSSGRLFQSAFHDEMAKNAKRDDDNVDDDNDEYDDDVDSDEHDDDANDDEHGVESVCATCRRLTATDRSCPARLCSTSLPHHLYNTLQVFLYFCPFIFLFFYFSYFYMFNTSSSISLFLRTCSYF